MVSMILSYIRSGPNTTSIQTDRMESAITSVRRTFEANYGICPHAIFLTVSGLSSTSPSSATRIIGMSHTDMIGSRNLLGSLWSCVLHFFD